MLSVCCRVTLLGLIGLFWSAAMAAGASPKKIGSGHAQVVAPEVYLAAPPSFLRPKNQQFFVAIDIPYDLFYFDGTFYLYARGTWFASDFYEGPWEQLGGQRLPVLFRNSKVPYLRAVRDHTAQMYADQKGRWPNEGLFIPESSAVDDDVFDDSRDSDSLPSGIDLGQETLNAKGE